jgi:hypothetical protein
MIYAMKYPIMLIKHKEPSPVLAWEECFGSREKEGDR